MYIQSLQEKSSQTDVQHYNLKTVMFISRNAVCCHMLQIQKQIKLFRALDHNHCLLWGFSFWEKKPQRRATDE